MDSRETGLSGRPLAGVTAPALGAATLRPWPRAAIKAAAHPHCLRTGTGSPAGTGKRDCMRASPA